MFLVPMLLLSGIASPMEALPDWAQYVMAFSPLRYDADITYGTFFKGAGLDIIRDSALSMALLGGATFGIGMWRFRRQFD